MAKATIKTLITGFEPFDGRLENASWVAAAALQRTGGEQHVELLRLPVVWDAPQPLLQATLAGERRKMLLGLGEGKAGCFCLESLACNRRAQRPDNTGNLPEREWVVPGGPAYLKSTAPLTRLRQELLAQGVPVVISLNAGGYLCDETLYLLEHQCRVHTESDLVVFMHLPPYGTALQFQGRQRNCDAELLTEFAPILLRVVQALP